MKTVEADLFSTIVCIARDPMVASEANTSLTQTMTGLLFRNLSYYVKETTLLVFTHIILI